MQKAVEQAKQTRDNKIAEAKGSQVNVDALKKSLDEKYQQLVASDKAKLDKIETDRQNAIKQIQANAQSEYDAKLKALGVDDQAVQAQIKQLQNAHEAFVKENANKLAQLKAEDTKAYNDLKTKLDAELAALMPKHETNTDHSGNVINTGDHTIVLPSTDEKDAAQEHPSVNSDNSKSTVSLAEKNNNFDNQTQTSVATANVDTNNDDTAVTALKVNATESATITRKEYKQQTKKLPQTGNSQSLVLVALGTLTSMFGFGLMRKRRY